jgi:hypothetical protein
LDDGDDHVLDRDHRKMSWRERERARKARAKKQGLYTFTSKDQGQTHIEGGRRETAFITVDLQGEDFHCALALQQDAKLGNDLLKQYLSFRRLNRGIKLTMETRVDSTPCHKPKKQKQERIIPGDLWIPLLHFRERVLGLPYP